MISLSQEWAALSRAMYQQDFINDLAKLLNQHRVKSILECGCGDGNVLNHLAKKGFCGIGIDLSPEMILMANAQNSHQNLQYKLIDWQDLDKINKKFDAVICRGNSLPSVVSWDAESINPREAQQKIEESIKLFFQRLKSNGLLYVDTTSQREIDQRGGKVEINYPTIHLIGEISHDWQRRIRKISGQGTINEEFFKGTTYSYLMKPTELEKIIKRYNPKRVFKPRLATESNYDVICAIK